VSTSKEEGGREAATGDERAWGKDKILKVLHTNCTGETREAKELHLKEISKTEAQVIDQQALTKVAADAAYDLFHQFICGKAKTQWDHIIKDMHKKYLGMCVNGAKTKGLRLQNWVSFKDYIELHKLTVFTCNTAEKQASYVMSSLKKPIKMTIHQHTMRMKVLNGYLIHLFTMKDSAMVVASTEKGNKPFNKATLMGMIMATCLIVVWCMPK
jgi:hypothetical protein